MSEARKAIIISTGMDNLQLLAALKESELATGVSLDRIKGLYAKFSEQKAALETRMNDQSLARLKANDDLKLAETERFFARQRAIYEENAAINAVGGGSVPAGMVHQGDGAAESAIAGGAAGALGGAARRGGNSGAVNEGRALLDEAAAGRYRRMIGSFLRFLGLLGVELIPLLAGIAVGALIDIVPFLRMRAAQKAADAAAKDLTKAQKQEGDQLREKISEMSKSGMMSQDDAAFLREKLGQGDVDFVLGQINKASGGRSIGELKTYSGQMKAAQAAQKKAQSELNNLNSKPGASETEQVRVAKDLQAANERIDFLKKSTAAYEAMQHRSAVDNLELEQEKARLLEDQVEAKKDQNEIDKTNADETKKQIAASIEQQKELQSITKDRQNLTQGFAADQQKQNMQFGSLGQIAHFGWQYSPRNGWQRTQAGSMAHELETLEGGNGHLGWQKWNRLHGNIDLANQQADREGYLKRTLGDMGYLPKDEKWEGLNNHLQQLNQKFAAVTAGKTLAVTIADVNDSQ